MAESLIYKLRYFGIPIDGPAEVYYENQSVPASTLNKSHNAIDYHSVRGAQGAGTIMVGWIESNFNLADLLTKTTMGNNLKYKLMNNIFNNDATPLKVSKVSMET